MQQSGSPDIQSVETLFGSREGGGGGVGEGEGGREEVGEERAADDGCFVFLGVVEEGE
jgi:hypothetical protein